MRGRSLWNAVLKLAGDDRVIPLGKNSILNSLDDDSVAAYNELLNYIDCIVHAGVDESVPDWLHSWVYEGRLQELCEVLGWPYGYIQRVFTTAMGAKYVTR